MQFLLPYAGPRRPLAALLAVTFVVGGLSSARAQDNRQQIIDELLRNLIQIEQDKISNQSLTSPAPSTINPATLPVKDPRALNAALKEFSTACADLAMSLYNDINRVSGVRPLLTDVYRLRARSSVLADKTVSGDEWKTLMEDISSIDRDWRVLSFKLAQVPDLSQSQTRLMARLDKSTETIGGLLKASPQVNYFELSQTLSALNVDIANLIDDIEIELGNSDSTRGLLIEAGKLQQQVRLIGTLVRDQSTHSRIVEEYGRFTKLWEPLIIRLQRLGNRYVDRNVRRIGESTRKLQELLWLPHEVDRQNLLYVTSLLKKDVDEFFSRTPLKLLIALPNSQYVLATADQFYGVCENFTDLVERNQNMAELVDAFRYIEETEEEFSRIFKPIRSQAALTVLTAIDRHVGELRNELVLNKSFDRSRATQLAASLANLSENLNLDTRIWLNRTQPNYRDKALQATARFAQLSGEFHRQILSGANGTQLATLSNQLYETWREVHGYISLSTNEDRIRLARLAAEIGPAIIELRTLVQL